VTRVSTPHTWPESNPTIASRGLLSGGVTDRDASEGFVLTPEKTKVTTSSRNKHRRRLLSMVTIPLLVSFRNRSFAPRLPNAASSWEALNYIESGYGTTKV